MPIMAIEQAEEERTEPEKKPQVQDSTVAERVGTPDRSTQHEQFVPDQSPQPGKELTLFLQYKTQIKKFVLADGYNDLSIARLR
jgi:hypothetical protein